MDKRQRLEILREKKRRKKNEHYKENFADFAQDHIKIITKDATQGFIPFHLNEAQVLITEQLEKQRKETGKVRAVILKARQQGISTYCAARVFWKTYYQAYTRSVVMAHDAATSDNLFNMSRNLIERMDPSMRPSYKKSNAKEIQFEHNEAGYRLYTAGSPEAGRGTTPTVLHASEVAFWQHDEKILAGLFNGLSGADGTEVILESTANGAQGEFYRLWNDAVEGKSEYIAIFIPWFVTSEYRRALPKDMTLEYTADEEDLINKFNLDDEQLYWRRLKIQEGGPRKFQQEYPAIPEEAFLVSGSNVFDPQVTTTMKAAAPKVRMEYNDDLGYFEPNNHGCLEIWHPPIFDKHYVIGVDVALGANQDYSVATVFDENRVLQAMYRRNNMDPGTFGDVLFYLGRYYNNALLAVESNSIGNTTLDRLMQMRYLNLYFEHKVSAMYTEQTEKLGFRTTSASKPRIIGQLKRLVEDYDIALPSETVIEELKSYVSTETGKTESLQGKHDDCVMSIAIAMEALRTNWDKLSSDIVPWKQKVEAYRHIDDTNWF